MKQKTFRMAKTNASDGKTPTKGRRALKIVAILLGAVVLFAIGWFSMGTRIDATQSKGGDTSPTQTDDHQAKTPDYNALIGDWQRADGPYLLRIRGVGADGRLDCAYFDPNPVEVSHAEIVTKGDAIQIYIELQKKGYPLAAYQLLYQPDKNILSGLYYQREDGGRYGVSFSRKAP